MTKISYRRVRPYKYQLMESYEHRLAFDVGTPGSGSWPKNIPGFLRLDNDGNLSIYSGYSWDGPSQPAIDTKNFMRGSLIHDSCYQLIREGLLDKDHRQGADGELRRICRADGMSWFRAWYVYRAVRLFAGAAAQPEKESEIFFAP